MAKKKRTDVADAESLTALLARLGVDPAHWDVFICGDGSGSTWDAAAGWAGVSVEKSTGTRDVFYGAVNRGTVNVAEIMAVLHPLSHVAARELDRREKTGRPRALRVHILTDSQYVRDTGQAGGRAAKKNAGLWACMDAFARQGLVLFWHWLPRDDAALNRYCDALGRAARVLIQSTRLAEKRGDDAGIALVNPNEDIPD